MNWNDRFLVQILMLASLSCRTSSGNKKENPPPLPPSQTIPSPEIEAGKNPVTDPFADEIEKRKQLLSQVIMKWKTDKPLPVRGRRDGYFKGDNYEVELLNVPASGNLTTFYDFSFDPPSTCKEEYFHTPPSLYSTSLGDGLHGRLRASVPDAITSCSLVLQARTRLGFDVTLKESRVVDFVFLRSQELVWDDSMPDSVLTLRDQAIKIPLKLKKVDPVLSEPSSTFSFNSGTCSGKFTSLSLDTSTNSIVGRSLQKGSCEMTVTATATNKPDEKTSKKIIIQIEDTPEKPVIINLSSAQDRNVAPLDELTYDFFIYDGNGDQTALKVKETNCPWKWTFLDYGASDTFPFARSLSAHSCAWGMAKDQQCYVDLIATADNEESAPYRLNFRMISDSIPKVEDMSLSQKICLVRVSEGLRAP